MRLITYARLCGAGCVCISDWPIYLHCDNFPRFRRVGGLRANERKKRVREAENIYAATPASTICLLDTKLEEVLGGQWERGVSALGLTVAATLYHTLDNNLWSFASRGPKVRFQRWVGDELLSWRRVAYLYSEMSTGGINRSVAQLRWRSVRDRQLPTGVMFANART